MKSLNRLLEQRNQAEKDYFEIDEQLTSLYEIRRNSKNVNLDEMIARLETERKMKVAVFEAFDEQICGMAY